MSGSRIRKGWKPISAFKEGYEATVAMLLRRIDQFLRDPFEVGFEELQPGKRVAEMRVETGRDEDGIRPERVERRQDARRHRLAKTGTIVARTERRCPACSCART
jgi:hypothetical protein